MCLSYAERIDNEIIASIVHARDPECAETLEKWLRDPSIQLVGQYVAYDLSIICASWPRLMPLVFEALEAGRITCTRIRQKLIDIAKGQYRGYTNAATGKFVPHKYGLADLSLRLLGRDISAGKGPDAWRLRYRELDQVPLEDWPQDAVDYPLSDAIVTLEVCEEQEEDRFALEDEFRQTCADFALKLISAWGIRTSLPMVKRWEAIVQARLDSHRDRLIEAGLVIQTKKGYQKRIKKAQEYALSVWAAKGVDDYPKTDTGLPKLDAEAAAKADDELFTAFQEYSSTGTIVSRIKELWLGVDKPIHTSFDSLMDTGRCSSTKPNIQNRAREPGDRECFVPRQGKAFAIADLDGFELRTIAQSCTYAVGYSRLAEVLNAKTGDELDSDPHLMMAATMLRIDFEEAKERFRAGDPEVDDARGARKAKMANFGFPAGLGVKGFIAHAMETGVIFTTEEAQKLYNDYLTTWPEMREYFAWIRAQLGEAGVATVRHFQSDRLRGMIPYTVACNTFSQGLGGDAAKHALFHLVRECYVGDGILRGSRVVNFIHDEYIVEVDDDEHAHDKAMVMTKIITDRANEWLPDVPTRAKPLLARRWSKKTKALYGADGRLIPWEWSEAIS